MNQRIKQLQFQAAAQIPPLLVASEWQQEFTKKFAQLLIHECAIIANRADNTETEIRCMYDVITEHFGVENDTY
jgi:chemotaxis response regulator CheB